MAKFSSEMIANEAYRRYGKPICMDTIEDASNCSTFDEAVMHILLDTVMWDSPSGNPFDSSIWESIKE